MTSLLCIAGVQNDHLRQFLGVAVAIADSNEQTVIALKLRVSTRLALVCRLHNGTSIVAQAPQRLLTQAGARHASNAAVQEATGGSLSSVPVDAGNDEVSTPVTTPLLSCGLRSGVRISVCWPLLQRLAVPMKRATCQNATCHGLTVSTYPAVSGRLRSNAYAIRCVVKPSLRV